MELSGKARGENKDNLINPFWKGRKDSQALFPVSREDYFYGNLHKSDVGGLIYFWLIRPIILITLLILFSLFLSQCLTSGVLRIYVNEKEGKEINSNMI